MIKEVAIHSSGEVIQIEDQINCKTKSVLYLLQSRRDPRQYAGQTGATIGTRTMQHGGDIDSEADKPVSNHFKLTGSSRRDLNEGQEQQHMGSASPGEIVHKQAQLNR